MNTIEYCCERFKQSVEEDNVIHKATDPEDETEWYISEGGHIYYCPFCGASIKGKGFGNYAAKYLPKRKI